MDMAIDQRELDPHFRKHADRINKKLAALRRAALALNEREGRQTQRRLISGLLKDANATAVFYPDIILWAAGDLLQTLSPAKDSYHAKKTFCLIARAQNIFLRHFGRKHPPINGIGTPLVIEISAGFLAPNFANSEDRPQPPPILAQKIEANWQALMDCWYQKEPGTLSSYLSAWIVEPEKPGHLPRTRKKDRLSVLSIGLAERIGILLPAAPKPKEKAPTVG